MSNLPPNTYSNVPGASPPNANTRQIFDHSQPFNQVPLNQLPPGYGGLKDNNSNSPLHGTVSPQNSAMHNVNNYNQSASSSPAFNQPGMVPQGLQSTSRPPTMPSSSKPSMNPIPTQHPPNYQPQRQINDNAPPLIPSSQYNQPFLNGPHSLQPVPMKNQYPVSSSAYNSLPMINKPLVSSGYDSGPINSHFGPPSVSKPPGPMPLTNQPNMPFSAPARNSPILTGPPVSGPPISGPPMQVPMSNTSMGPPGIPVSATTGMPPPLGPNTMGINGPNTPKMLPPVSGPPTSLSGPVMPPPATEPSTSSYPGLYNGPNQPISKQVPIGQNTFSGQPPQIPPPATGPPTSSYPGLYNGPNQPISKQVPIGQNTFSAQPPQIPPPATEPPTSSYSGLYNGPNQPIRQPVPIEQNTFSGQPPQMPPPMAQNIMPLPEQGLLSGPIPPGPPKSNMQNRYPQMPQSNYNHQQPMVQSAGKQYPQQYNTQGMTQQMGQLSVTKQGFDQLWGHHMFDLLQNKHILPEYPEEPPEIRLAHQFAESPNCSPEIFRCTVNRIPETNSLLQKSRLPLGILIHPFKDLNHLPVIQCTTIVRCRACRTYINPFVYFVDSKRWKCNLCYRVNDLPEEFQYDPVSKSYGDPSRRPEIKSATIEFIAPGEYMLRPPQPAVYLFLFDVSQLARESGYLQVACDTLKNNLDQLPGDARTQIGFICYDSHVHYYLMSEGLTRPKEMTVLDIEDIFLPSPEALLVNLGERRELVRELLSVLPQRYSTPGTPASALGAALQAAYKLMSPTGGRVTVFQTCLPNAGPGALQPREDPNARSSKDVAHLNPATDFYKRIALDCSGAQIAVDLFLLNSQYSDLATLSGVSKFSAGTLYHIPLFKAARAHQAETLTRMFTRYITRKIGFEAVMRVRCTRGISIHTFHGNFFVRSTDLLSLPNVSPDAGFGMQLTIEESLSDLQQVCFQAALLYTSSKGERRIRVHTLALPIASSLTDVLHSADQQCIIGLVSKMAADRCVSASLAEAREAVSNVCVDALSAFRLSQNLPSGANSASLHAPTSLRLLPLYLLALLKRKAFRMGTSTRLDDRVADMCGLKCLPLGQLTRLVYPDLYPLHTLRDHTRQSTPTVASTRNTAQAEDDEESAPDPPRLQLSAERINSTGAYLLDDGESMIIYVCNAVSPAFLSDTFGVAAYSQLPDEAHSLPKLDSEGNALLHAFIDKLNDERPYPADILILRDNSPSRLLFTERLVDDRVESAFSYYEFLQHVKSQVK